MTFKDLSLKYKIGGSICLAVTIILVVYTFVIVSKTREISVHDAEQIAIEMANRYGNEVKGSMEKALDASLSTGAAFEAMIKNREIIDRKIVDEIQQAVVLSDDTFYGIQSCFEPNALDGRDAEFTPRATPCGSTWVALTVTTGGAEQAVWKS